MHGRYFIRCSPQHVLFSSDNGFWVGICLDNLSCCTIFLSSEKGKTTLSIFFFLFHTLHIDLYCLYSVEWVSSYWQEVGSGLLSSLHTKSEHRVRRREKQPLWARVSFFPNMFLDLFRYDPINVYHGLHGCLLAYSSRLCSAVLADPTQALACVRHTRPWNYSPSSFTILVSLSCPDALSSPSRLWTCGPVSPGWTGLNLLRQIS